MRKPIKAALLSGLVFPGVGQLYLGQKRRGICIFFSAFLTLVFIVFHLINLVYGDITLAVAKGEAVDVVALEKTISGDADVSIRIGSVLLVVLWVLSVFLALNSIARIPRSLLRSRRANHV